MDASWMSKELTPTYCGMHHEFDKIDWQRVKWIIDGVGMGCARTNEEPPLGFASI